MENYSSKKTVPKLKMPEILSSDVVEDVVESIDNEYSDEEGDDYDDTETATKPSL